MASQGPNVVAASVLNLTRNTVWLNNVGIDPDVEFQQPVVAAAVVSTLGTFPNFVDVCNVIVISGTWPPATDGTVYIVDEQVFHLAPYGRKDFAYVSAIQNKTPGQTCLDSLIMAR
jgi:hypothetical protein